MRRALRAAVAFGTLLVLASVACFIAAIWTVGPNSGRIAGTGALILIVGLITTLIALPALDMRSRR